MAGKATNGQVTAAVIGAIGVVLAALVTQHCPSQTPVAIFGTVEDSCTDYDIPDAEVTFMGKKVTTDANGHFEVSYPRDKITDWSVRVTTKQYKNPITLTIADGDRGKDRIDLSRTRVAPTGGCT